MTWQDVARAQYGVISRPQIRAAGHSDEQIDRLISSRHLRADRRRGVYRAGGVHTSESTECWSAVLSTRSTLSHLSAARVWGIEAPDDGRLHVTAPASRRTVMPNGVRVHRVLLPSDAVVEQDGLPITDRSRTVMDCLGLLPEPFARTLFDRSLQRKLISLEAVELRLRSEPNRRGNRQLWKLLDEASLGEAESERVLHRILSDAGITGWLPSVPIGPYVGDVVFDEERLIVEVDGWAYHSGVERFAHDRLRQNALMNQGWRFLRFTWAHLVEQPGYVVQSVRTALAAH
jgi:very-short-patch-repair endonuclease